MSYMSDPMGYALDMHITGHYGEDQFRGDEEFESICDTAYEVCVFQKLNQCPLDNWCDEGCLVVKAVLGDYAKAKERMDEEYFEAFIEQEAERWREQQMEALSEGE